MKKVAFHTLGCKVNQYETEALASLFRRQGYQVVEFSDKADVYVINTCTVTHLGDRKSRQMIRRAKRNNPDAIVAVMGCYAQTSPGEVTAIEGVDLVIGTSDRSKVVECVEDFKRQDTPVNLVKDIMQAREFEELPVLDYESRTRAFLKIQEGCNNFCTYCIIPYARGPVRSRKRDNVITEAERLVGEGFREIVLTGIHIGAYGRDRDDGYDLAALVADLARIKGLRRLRLGSVEPEDVTPQLIATMADNRVICRHLHLPLQSGDDAVLEKMNRKYNTHEFTRLVNSIRAMVDDIAITTDIIVGFPGETDEQFDNTYNYVKALGFSRLHVFKYSPRKGTPAANFPGQVPAETKEERSSRLIELGKEMGREFARCFLGREMEVLVEQRLEADLHYMEGLTDNYLAVAFPGGNELKGEFVTVKLTSVKEEHVFGEVKADWLKKWANLV